MPERFYLALKVAAVLTGLGALAGVGAFFRKREKVSATVMMAVMINSGLFAGAFFLLLDHFNPDAWGFNIALSVISGLGGNTTLGFGIRIWENIVRSQIPMDGTDHGTHHHIDTNEDDDGNPTGN